MELLYEQNPLLKIIVKKISEQNGKPYLVGGAVRDMIMNLPIKDIDIEVHGISQEKLEDILQQYGAVNVVGKSFGVLRLHGVDVDWSLPRIDSAGRKPTVKIDPHMTIEEAARRRDVTMNAMAIDLLTEELIDPFGGKQDIQNKVLRTPDAALFVQDPLRFYRVMQFISRFEMMPDQELDAVCSRIDIAKVSRERIEQEFKKLLLLSKKPSLGIRWMQKIGRLEEVLPELAAATTVPQNPQWHPEGTVFEHLMQTIDAAVNIVQSYDNEQDKLIMLYAALCHDLGKITTTTCVDGVIKSIGHENEIELVRTMMRRITHEQELISAVLSLVKHHMAPLQFVANNAKLPAYKRLASKLVDRVSIKMLSDLSCADRRGRNGKSHEPLASPGKEIETFVATAQKAGVFEHKEAPVLTGDDLIAYVSPGPRIGVLLEKAYKIQIETGITDKNELLKGVLGKSKKVE